VAKVYREARDQFVRNVQRSMRGDSVDGQAFVSVMRG
jgi:hypothetical protein